MKTVTKIAKGVTVDPKNSLKLDDAFWVEKTDEGWSVKIYCANVASIVGMNSKNDRSAYSRSCSSCEIKNGQGLFDPSIAISTLSLLPGMTRRTIEISFKLDYSLEVSNFKISKVLFQSVGKFGNEDVEEILKDRTHPSYEWWQSCLDLAVSLLKKRVPTAKAHLYLNLSNPGSPDDEMTDSNRILNRSGPLISCELMHLANSLITSYVIDRKASFIFNDRRGRNIKSLAIRSKERIQNTHHLRCHSPLRALETYRRFPIHGHWTSAIRRYSDLVNQRILNAILDEDDAAPYEDDQLEEICTHINSYVETSTHTAHARRRERLIKRIKSCSKKVILLLPRTDFDFLIEILANGEVELDLRMAKLIKLRLSKGNDQLRAYGMILFAFTHESKQWRMLAHYIFELVAQKKTLRRYITRSPELLCIWATFKIEFRKLNSKLFVTASFENRSVVHHTEFTFTNNKALATTQAKLNLIAKLIRYPKNKRRKISIPTETEFSYWSQINSFCTINTIKAPSIATRIVEIEGKQKINCSVSVVVSGRTFKSLNRNGETIQIARDFAAKQLMEQLQVAFCISTKLKIITTEQAMLDPNSVLNKWCQKQEVVPVPQYTFTYSGDSDDRWIRCSASITVKGKTFCAITKKREKKLAKQEASLILFSEIKKSLSTNG